LPSARSAIRQILQAAFAALPFCAAVAQAATRIETPVALILSTSRAEVEKFGTLTRLTAHPGMVLFPGERLFVRDGTVEVAFCPGKELVSLQAGSIVRFESTARLVEKGAVNGQMLPLCVLPEVARVPAPRNFGTFGGESIARDTLEQRIARLPSAQRQIVDSGFRQIESARETGAPPLIASIAKAVVLERGNLLADAARIYRQIREEWPEADWTRDMIARLGEMTLAAPIPGSPSEGNVFAFVAGISKYLSPHVKPLQFADEDARLFASYLNSPRGGGLVRGKNLWLLTNEMATRDRMTAELTAFVEGKATQDSTLVIYIAAHGAYVCVDRRTYATRNLPCEPGKGGEEPYILAYDSDPEDPKVSAIRMPDLHDLITSHASQFGTVLLYLDVCHSGALGALPLETNLTSNHVGDLFPAGGDFGLLLASARLRPKDREKEFALEDPQFGGGHGVFTYFVVKGLNGEVPPNQRNVVSIESLMAHVQERVRRETGNRQTPVQRATRADLPVVADASKSGIHIPEMIGNRGNTLHSRDNASLAAKQSRAIELSADQSGLAPPSSRVMREQEGQQVILTYLNGEQSPQRQTDFDRGAQAFEDALAINGDRSFTESRLLFCRGRALIFSKRYADAQRMLERSIRIDPGRGYAFNALGIAYLEQAAGDAANLPRAVASFEDAIRVAPYWAYPVHNLALAEEQLGNYVAAIRQYRKAMTLAPYASYPVYNLGLLYQRLNRFDKAQEMYRLAISNGTAARWPNLSEGYNALGTLLAARGRDGAARAQFENALREDARNSLAQHNLALLEAKRPDGFDSAERRWRRILAVEPTDVSVPVVRISLAEQLVKHGRLDEAVMEYQAILDANPTFTAARRALALVMVETGDTVRAVAEINQALFSAPSASLERTRDDINRIRGGQQPRDPELRRIQQRSRSAARNRGPVLPPGRNRQ
jgi:tetratricopeptide (TPR) repeat protein